MINLNYNDLEYQLKNHLIIDKELNILMNAIELKNVSFSYPNQNDYSIKDVSLTIPIGQSVAFIGESGAGKTTIVDIILGLFTPEKGKVLVDGKKLDERKQFGKKKLDIFLNQYFYQMIRFEEMLHLE